MTAREELLKEAKRLLALLPPEEAMKIIMDVLNERKINEPAKKGTAT